MATKRYRVKLTAEEREELKALTTKGRVSARKQTHARILLQCDECREDGGRTDSAIAPALCGGGTGGGPEPEGAVEPAGEGSGWGGGSLAGGDGDPPEGYARWSLRLLADCLVECEIVDGVSWETVCRTLKKTILNRG